MIRSARQRKCKVCATPFTPFSSTAKVCGVSCAVELSKQIAAKKDRAETKAKKEAMRPRKWWLAKAKKAMHAYVRARDEGKTCISCDTVLVKLGRVGGDYDAGHFRSVGSAKHLEFDERNIHGQCKHCNKQLAGNHAEYERGLIERYDRQYVDDLYADNAPRHYGIEDFQAIEANYKAKLKQLQGAK